MELDKFYSRNFCTHRLEYRTYFTVHFEMSRQSLLLIVKLLHNLYNKATELTQHNP